MSIYNGETLMTGGTGSFGNAHTCGGKLCDFENWSGVK